MAALLCLAHRAPQADEPSFKALEKTYAGEIRPLIARYCHNCHSAKQAEADIDLASFATLADVRSQPKTWQKVREMLESGQMPPKKARQPGEAERTRLKQWVRDYLTVEARAMAGDPGRVVLRRLSNAEYTYTIRDLTGVASLEPAREFPVDGAAGEGFTNTGNALVMSPALITKYLDAAKEIAAHAVLFPDGIRFSPHATRRDWTDDTLAQIREFYGRFTDATGGTQVNLQGIISETNQGGRLPLQKYLLATLAERDSLANGGAAVEKIAQARGLNARYLGTLWQTLTDAKPSSLLDGLRARWRAATPDDAASLAAFVSSWQNELWKFATVGHIGKVGGPKAWMEPVNPLVARRDLRVKIPAEPESGEIVFSLVASDAGDGSENDIVVWEKPRLVAPGRPDLLLRDVRRVAGDLAVRRERVFANAAKYLNAADEVSALDTSGKIDLADLAQKHGVEVDALRAWLGYLGIGEKGPVTIEGHFADKLSKVSGYDFVNGWGTNETPLLVANSSDQHVRIPGNMKPHGVAVHPSPTLRAVVGWRSPISGVVSVSARIAHAHPECGNGVTWSLELRRGGTRQRLANGIAHGNAEVKSGPIEKLAVQPGDLVSLLIGPRDGHHACDLTAVDLALAGAGEGGPKWNLADDVSNDVHAGNPHADRLGHANVWHFYTERDNGGELGPVIPTGSLLAKWQTTGVAAEKQKLAAQVQSLLTFGPPADKNSPDAALYRQLASLGGPLFGARAANRADEKSAPAAGDWGPDPALFGKHPLKGPVDPANLYVRAPSVVEIRLPADLVAGCELVTTGLLDGRSGTEGSAQLQLVPGTLPSSPVFQPGTPIVANEGGAARKRLESAFDEFRRLFPIALCYTRIVPVDEAVTLTLFYREDDHLARLMLDERQKSQLDRLWDQLHYVSQDALTLVDAFAQLMEYATQDADPKVFEPLREPINARAAAFRQAVLDSEPAHLNSILDFATRAYRRPLAPAEISEVRELYARLRAQDISHDEAIRLTLARVLVAPAFLYRIEKPGPGSNAGPVSDWELASRLSYFLWSSQPDDDLLRVASTGRLRDQGVLLAQTRRMLRDPRVRRLATEFACQWLHIHDFDQLDEKSERHFPTFAGLRGDMYEESIQFFTDMFQNAGSVVDILDADHTFVNDNLAAHYGLPSGPAAAPGAPAVQDSQSSAWRRVEGVKPYGRGGILAQAATLAKQSGASRTSPILRGNWISEVLLGERLPRPPKEVPRLPEDETATEGLTVRQLVEKHTSDPKCSICHQRIDAFGFALEGFDAIGRRRDKDLGDRPIDTRAKAPDGAQLDGLEGLRKYLVTARREAFVRQFCRKLLGYALGRAVQLSDEPLLDEMENELKANSYKITAAIETIVRSRPFREIRGREAADDQ
ncbi:MAG TPA: DUF1592 domain-containing protein [Planctomycetaceae bacterium]|nr:DUF1592 domain-containing protein [Planctomycetaceae bacterium]